MITLNHARNRQTMNDVLTELDAYEAEIMTTAKPFTAFILDTDRQPEDPRVVHFNTTSGAMMEGDIETAYFYDCNCGDDDDDFEPFFVLSDTINAWWQHKGAAIMGVIAGHHDFVWNPDGMNCGNDDFAFAFDLARKAEEKAAADDPFKESYRSAWVSTCHISARSLDGLNALRDSGLLPFYIHDTVYGYIVRFDALEQYGLADDEKNTIIKRLAASPDMVAIKEALYKHGYQVAHLDSDGPVIEGLEEYDHE